MVYLDLQGHQSDHCRAEGQRWGEVWAQVEEGEPVSHARGTDHTHHLTKHTKTLKQHCLPNDVCTLPVSTYQIDTDVDERAKVREERDDRLPLQG